MDGSFIRNVAALQAHVITLDEDANCFTELSDMQAVRQFKTQLEDYIGAHAAKGTLPPDPYGLIAERLIEVARFFEEAEKESDSLLNWKKDWLNKVPKVGLKDLQQARADLNRMVQKLPEIRERLAAMIHPRDWNESKSDLHAELLVCASTLGDISLPKSETERVQLFQFTHGHGDLSMRVDNYLSDLRARIGDLEQLHARHDEQLQVAEQHLALQNFRSAAEILVELEQNFSDIPYIPANQALENLMAKHREVDDLSKSLDEKLKGGGWKDLPDEFDRHRRGIAKPDSELGRECLALLDQMESRLSSFLAARKAKRIKGITVGVVVALLGTALFLLVSDANAKAEKARIEAAEAKAKAKAEAYEKFRGNHAGEQKTIEIAPGVNMTFCWCPAGEFMMGSPASETGRGSDEGPVKVTLSKGFWMSKTEVTQEQWQAVMGTNPSKFKGANLPVESVSWNGAQGFLKNLNPRVGSNDSGRMVLPTEAQWEYAARAGENRIYSGGPLDQVGWYKDNGGGETHPVGTKKANAWGLHDMSGNIFEWCADWYTEDLEGGIDPNGRASGSYRVIRGGSWLCFANDCRVAIRDGYYPTSSSTYFGFRVARISVP